MPFQTTAAAHFCGLRTFHQLINFAGQCAAERRPFTEVVDAMDALPGWSSGPAGVRASVALEQAAQNAYRSSQIERAKAAIAAFMQDNFDPSDDDRWSRDTLIESACITGACATHAQDGDYSTLIEPADIVALIAEYFPIEDRTDAEWHAEQALRDFHTGWRVATPEEDQEVAEAEAEMDAYLSADAVFAALPADADFPAALRDAHPLLTDESAAMITSRTVARLARQPVRQFVPVSDIDPFAGGWREPNEAAFQLHEKALKMGDLSFLRLVEPVVPWTGDLEDMALAQTATMQPRHDPITGVLDLRRRLACVDFDPTAEFRPPAWLVKGVLPHKGIGLLVGESGSGKTFLAIHAALCVAWGVPFFGRRTRPGGVLYVAAEGGSSVLPRLRAADMALGAVVGAQRLAGNSLTRSPLRIVTEAPNLSKDGNPIPLVATIEDAAADFASAGSRLALVVIDTYHGAMGGGDENSAADAGAVLAPLRAAAETHGALILVVHHLGKDTERGARGSNALPAAADAIIGLTVPGHKGHVAKPSIALRTGTVTKQRDGEAGEELAYRLPIVPLGTDEDGDPWTTCVVEPCSPPPRDKDKLTGADRDFMEALVATIGERPDGRALLKEVRLHFYAGRADAKPAAKRVAFGRALLAAIKAGRIEVDEAEEWAWIN